MGKMEIKDGVLRSYKGKDKHIVVPDGVLCIDDEAFHDCKAVETIVLPEGLRRIGNFAFSNCSALRTINIPQSVRSIGYGAFDYCQNLQPIVIPIGVKMVDGELFHYCGLGLHVHCEAAQKPVGWHEYWLCGDDDMGGDEYPEACSEEEEEEVEDWTAEWVTWGHRNITFDSTYDYVEHDGKAHLTRYKGNGETVIVPDEIDGLPVACIGDVFVGHKEIVTLVLPDTIAEIVSYAFKGCTALASLTIGQGVKTIGKGILLDCPAIQTIVVAKGNKTYHSQDNCVITTQANTLRLGCLSSVLPRGLDGISEDAFHCCLVYDAKCESSDY